MAGQADAGCNKRRREDSEGKRLPTGGGVSIMPLSHGRDWQGTMDNCEDTVATLNDFLRNNAHLLTTSSAETGENQVLQSMKLMAETIGQQRVQLAQQSEQLIQMNKTLTCVATTLLDLQNTMKQNTDFAVHCIASQGEKNTLAPSNVSPLPPSPRAAACARAVTTPTTCVRNPTKCIEAHLLQATPTLHTQSVPAQTVSNMTSPTGVSHLQQQTNTDADGDDDNAGAARSHLTVVTTKADVPQTMLSLATLMPFHNTSVSRAHLPSSVAGVKAWSFFQQYMSKGHTSIPSGSNRHLDDGKALMDWFLSMSTPEERKVLLPPTPVTSLKDVSLLAQLDPVVQDAMRKFICLRLDVLVRARLILCYFDARLPCPPLLLSCGGGPNNAPIDDSLSGSAVAQHVKYLRGMGQTALVPVLHNLLEWRRQHQLYTCNPDKVLVLAEVLHRIHSKWTVRTTATKKELVLEGFLLLPEWADKVGGKMRTRPWNARYAVKEDEEWVRQYNAQVLAQEADGRGGQG